MLDVANTYLGLWSKLEYVDMWYSVPQPSDADRKASQRWHRDFNDQHLLKAFLYLVDVDEGTGPFEYVPGSAPGGRYADAWPWRPLGENYPPDGELEQRIPEEGIRTFTAPKGTMVFCNTSGFHRGGFATEQSARARDRDVLLPCLARVAHRAQLHASPGRPTSSTRRRCSRSPEQLAEPNDGFETILCFRRPEQRRVTLRLVAVPWVPQMQHRRGRSRPSTVQSTAAKPDREILVLPVVDWAASFVEPVHLLEVDARHPDEAVGEGPAVRTPRHRHATAGAGHGRTR